MRVAVLDWPLALAGIGRQADLAPTQAQMEGNVRRLILDITWYGILVGTTINLMQVYVVRLGAPSLLVGAVTYGPALVSIFWQIPAAQWMRRRGHRMRWVLGAGFLHRFAFLAVALLPFFAPAALAQLTVAVLILQAFATTISATSFLSMMADAVPQDQISHVVTSRNAAFGLTSTLSTLLAALVLARVAFPLNYQLLFIAGFTASLLSQYSVAGIRVPDRQGVRAKGRGWNLEFGRMLGLPRFLQFVGLVGLVQMALGMVVPLLPLFAVRQLGASDAQISLVVTMFSASTVAGSLLMRKFVRRAGRERVLAVGALGYTVYPLLISLSSSMILLITWAAIGGLFYAAITVTLFDNLLRVTPEGDKTNYVAIYNLFVNAALFVGPLIATVLAGGASGPAVALRLAAAISLLAGVLFVFWMKGAVPDA